MRVQPAFASLILQSHELQPAILAALVTCPMERDRLITIRDKSDHDIAAGMTRVAGSGILNAFKPPPRMPCNGPAAVLVDEK
jgi:hypothetical protein